MYVEVNDEKCGVVVGCFLENRTKFFPVSHLKFNFR